jgi:hypothetical protein
MTKFHTVSQGESVAIIAKKYGFPSWDILYNHSDNSGFKTLRPNPDIIFPGDKIFIPELQKSRFNVKANQRHVFRSQAKKDDVVIKIGAIGGTIWSDRKVELDINGSIVESKTDAKGNANFKLPKGHAEEAILLVYTLKDTNNPSYRVSVKLGHLDPITEYIGQQARLTALGYDCGLLTNKANQRFENATNDFQTDNELTVDGICGPNTQQTLEKVFGC